MTPLQQLIETQAKRFEEKFVHPSAVGQDDNLECYEIFAPGKKVKDIKSFNASSTTEGYDLGYAAGRSDERIHLHNDMVDGKVGGVVRLAVYFETVQEAAAFEAKAKPLLQGLIEELKKHGV